MWYGLIDAQRRAARALAGESRNGSPFEWPRQALWNVREDGANAFSQWLLYPGFVQQAAIVAVHPERQLRLESAYWSNWFTGNMPDAMRALGSLNEYAAVLDMAECYFVDMQRDALATSSMTEDARQANDRRYA